MHGTVWRRVPGPPRVKTFPGGVETFPVRAARVKTSPAPAVWKPSLPGRRSGRVKTFPGPAGGVETFPVWAAAGA